MSGSAGTGHVDSDIHLAETTDETTSLIDHSTSLLSEPSYGTQQAVDEGDDVQPETVSAESEEIDVGGSGAEVNETNESMDEDSSQDGEETRDGAIGTLTRRLRCLFSTITWPIVPLGTIVALALLWVLYAASSLDLRRSCSHPLHWYALASLILVAYIPHHAQVRSHMFHYSRERDGPIRPARVRMYDQFFHTVCLLYVYTGVTLIQTCREDIGGSETVSDLITADIQPSDTQLNSCAATCPNLYQALSVYVATLEMFTFALILPLLFLPCIYLWFLRRATAEAEAFAQLQDRLQEEEALLSNGGVTANEILDSLESVKLVAKSQEDPSSSEERQLWLMPCSATDVSIGMPVDVKECCICMSDFPVQDEADLENGLFQDDDENSSKDAANESQKPSEGGLAEKGIVRTRCGHIFHRECLAGWVGGRWQINPQGSGDDTALERRRRRARQTACPLCREDLRPTNN